MDNFQTQLMRRSPLAAAMLEIGDFVFDDRLMESIWQQHRGRCYDDVLKFPDLLRLMRDALIHCGGSAHQLFLDLEARDAEPCDESNFYRKLARTPVNVSQALLRECTLQRLKPLMPASQQAALASCFDSFTVVAGDGKKIKKAAKRLKPTRGYTGSLVGAKALVGIDLRSGLALALSSSLDGMTNDVPLVPELMDQLRQTILGPLLSVWDRQFDDLGTIGRLTLRPGDAAVVRMRKHLPFAAQTTVESRDKSGRLIIDQVGVMSRGRGRGHGPESVQLRRVTLVRGNGEEDVIVLTNLLDAAAFPAIELLNLYKLRWNIEQVFQEVTETFGLQNLIGSSPKATLLQLTYCLLLYNMVQAIKAFIADDGKVLATTVSSHYLFNDIRREMTAWAYHSDGTWPRSQRTVNQMQTRLQQLLKDRWDARRYTKASDRKARPIPPPLKTIRGRHSSVQRLLEANVK